MSTFAEIRTDVIAWTNRSKMVAETNMAIKQAIRTAHKAGKFWRDLQVLPLTGVSTASAIQSIDLASSAPFYRQIAYVKPATLDMQYTAIGIDELFDPDKYYRLDVYYGVGNALNIRASSPATSIDIAYYSYPNITDTETFSNWMTANHADLITLWAAATMLALVGEQEVKTRVEALSKLAYQDMIDDNISIAGR